MATDYYCFDANGEFFVACTHRGTITKQQKEYITEASIESLDKKNAEKPYTFTVIEDVDPSGDNPRVIY